MHTGNDFVGTRSYLIASNPKITRGPNIDDANKTDSDQSARTRRLIRVPCLQKLYRSFSHVVAHDIVSRK